MTVGDPFWDGVLAHLSGQWGDCYDIRRLGPVCWVTARKDGRGMVAAGDPETLLQRIRADHEAKPMPGSTGHPDR